MALPIGFSFDKEHNILLTRAEGVVSLEDIEAHLDEEAEHGCIDRRELFDASDASTTLTVHEVQRLVSRVARMARASAFGPTALITTNDTFFGMANMLSILLGLEDGPRLGVFRTRGEALAWLGHPEG